MHPPATLRCANKTEKVAVAPTKREREKRDLFPSFSFLLLLSLQKLHLLTRDHVDAFSPRIPIVISLVISLLETSSFSSPSAKRSLFHTRPSVHPLANCQLSPLFCPFLSLLPRVSPSFLPSAPPPSWHLHLSNEIKTRAARECAREKPKKKKIQGGSERMELLIQGNWLILMHPKKEIHCGVRYLRWHAQQKRKE